MKSKTFMKEVSGLSAQDIRGKINTISEELMKLRFKAASSQIDKPHLIKDLRRKVARLETLLTAKRQAVN